MRDFCCNCSVLQHSVGFWGVPNVYAKRSRSPGETFDRASVATKSLLNVFLDVLETSAIEQIGDPVILYRVRHAEVLRQTGGDHPRGFAEVGGHQGRVPFSALRGEGGTIVVRVIITG